jgi:hypothetical protein
MAMDGLIPTNHPTCSLARQRSSFWSTRPSLVLVSRLRPAVRNRAESIDKYTDKSYNRLNTGYAVHSNSRRVRPYSAEKYANHRKFVVGLVGGHARVLGLCRVPSFAALDKHGPERSGQILSTARWRRQECSRGRSLPGVCVSGFTGVLRGGEALRLGCIPDRLYSSATSHGGPSLDA